MSSYDDYGGPPRDRRSQRQAPYPDADDGDVRHRNGRADAAAPSNGSQAGAGKSDIPPPPLGSAMKRDGSRSRVPHLRPDFPDEASYLNGRSPDLERKNDDRDRKFRERRGGYEDDEGDTLRSDQRRRRERHGDGDPRSRAYDDDDRGARSGGESRMPVRGGPPRDRYDDDAYDRRRPKDYDDRRRPARDYDDRPRRRDDYYDGDLPPRRRGHRDGVEYGADPIKSVKRSNTERRSDGRGRRDDDYDDDDDDYRVNRRKSQPPPRRNDRYDDDYDRDTRDRRRRDDYDRDDRPPRRRRSYDDYDDYDRRDRRDGRDRRDRRDDRDGRDRKEPTHMKIGSVDLGPALDKGQKYYSVVAPVLTPLVMNYLKGKK